MQKIFRTAVVIFMLLAGFLSIKQNAYSEGCTICSDNVPWVNHALQSTYPLGTDTCYYYEPYFKRKDGTTPPPDRPMIFPKMWFVPNKGFFKTEGFDLTDPKGKRKIIIELTNRILY